MMVAGIFHSGSGLGNMLHRYVATRVLALDKGYLFRMINPELFKGASFMKIDMGDSPVRNHNFYPITDEWKMWQEKKVVENGVDIRSYDPEFNFIEPKTIIDGEFQDERYWAHREDDVNEWLKVNPLDMPDDLCVIGFRGGEFSVFPDLFLTKEYWEEAISIMKKKNPNMRFEVHTDDPITAQQFFPDFECTRDIGLNWRSVRYAKQAIIANSSFYIFPRWLNKGFTIAPRYWARRNIGVWALPQNYYSRFYYI